MTGPEVNRKLKGRIVQVFGSESNFGLVIGQAQSTVSRVIHGFKSLDAETKAEWAKSLDCAVEDIFPSNGHGKRLQK